MVRSLRGSVPARRARAGAEHVVCEGLPGWPQWLGHGVDAALAPTGGESLGLVGRYREVMFDEVVLQ
jgi:hypothetical protein